MSDKIRTILWLCVLGATPFMLFSCGKSERTLRVGDHQLDISETRLGGWGRGTLYSLPDGTQAYTYESNTIKVKLEHEVLTVNGKRYLVPHTDDSVRITDDRVEINGQPARPE